MDSPYETPGSGEPVTTELQEIEVRRKRRFWRRSLAGALVVVALVIGGAGYRGLVVLAASVETLGEDGSADPQQLAGDLSSILLTVLWAFVLCLPAIVFALIALVRLLALPKLQETGGRDTHAP